jgi:hypothetical protein
VFNRSKRVGLKLKYAFLWVLLITFSCAQQPKINEEPMYKRSVKTPEMLVADSIFIATVTQNSTRDSASQYFAHQGFKFIDQGDYPTAIKRFNQSWLLDSNNYLAHWGFAAYARATGKPEARTNQHMRKAYTLNSQHCELAFQVLVSDYILKNEGVINELDDVKKVIDNMIVQNCPEIYANMQRILCDFGLQLEYGVTCTP